MIGGVIFRLQFRLHLQDIQGIFLLVSELHLLTLQSNRTVLYTIRILDVSIVYIQSDFMKQELVKR